MFYFFKVPVCINCSQLIFTKIIGGTYLSLYVDFNGIVGYQVYTWDHRIIIRLQPSMCLYLNQIRGPVFKEKIKCTEFFLFTYHQEINNADEN